MSGKRFSQIISSSLTRFGLVKILPGRREDFLFVEFFPAEEFGLDAFEGGAGDDGGVGVFEIILFSFAVVFSNFVGEEVGDVGFLENGVALIFFVSEDTADSFRRPARFPTRGGDVFFGQSAGETAESRAS